jgi:glycerol-3-phosphate acyltransferase PlsY
MEIIAQIGVLVLAYFIGSIPFGLIIVKVSTGKDVRFVESGRTGGTNAARAAGYWAGLATGVLDVIKGFSVVKLGHWLVSGSHPWIEVLAPLIAILGHNYSIFLIRRDENGWLKFHGGAGGATCLGGSTGLWFPSLWFIVPIGALIYYFVGYASITTLSIAFVSIIIFAYRAWLGLNPWQYAVYGLLATGLLGWSLRPNIKRLVHGNERVVGLRARKHRIQT